MVGEEVTVLLSTSSAEAFAGGRFWINYDSRYLSLNSVSATELTADFESGFEITDDGRAVLILAGDTALAGGSGEILKLVFGVNEGISIPAKTEVVFAEIELYGQYAQDLSWDSMLSTTNGTLYVARPGLNLYPATARWLRSQGLSVTYLIVPVEGVTGRYDISFGVISEPERNIYVTGLGFTQFLPFQSVAQTPRVAGGVDCSRYHRGAVSIMPPGKTCTDNFRFAAALFEKGTNSISQLTRSVSIKLMD
jgi:hypothetical protein